MDSYGQWVWRQLRHRNCMAITQCNSYVYFWNEIALFFKKQRKNIAIWEFYRTKNNNSLYNLLVILLIASEKLIALDMNLQFAICNFSDCTTKPTVCQCITARFRTKNCKLQIANCKFTCPNTSYWGDFNQMAYSLGTVWLQKQFIVLIGRK